MKIERDIPVPSRGGRLRTVTGKIVREMEPGTSILFDTPKEADAARYVGYSIGWKMAIRKTPEGWRVWRVS